MAERVWLDVPRLPCRLEGFGRVLRVERVGAVGFEVCGGVERHRSRVVFLTGVYGDADVVRRGYGKVDVLLASGTRQVDARDVVGNGVARRFSFRGCEVAE